MIKLFTSTLLFISLFSSASSFAKKELGFFFSSEVAKNAIYLNHDNRGNYKTKGHNKLFLAGDAKPINSIPISRNKLAEIKTYLTKKIENSNIPQNFKEKFLNELDFLIRKGKIQYSSEDIFQLGGNRFEGDYDSVISTEALTWTRQGSPILLANSVAEKSIKYHSYLIAMEIPHHILSEKFKKDESFVNSLALGIMNEKVSDNLISQLLADKRLKSKEENYLIFEDFENVLEADLMGIRYFDTNTDHGVDKLVPLEKDISEYQKNEILTTKRVCLRKNDKLICVGDKVSYVDLRNTSRYTRSEYVQGLYLDGKRVIITSKDAARSYDTYEISEIINRIKQ